MKLLITCGGTGGHIYPAIAIAQKTINKFEDINNLLHSIENQLLLGNSQQLCKQQLEYVVTP